MNRYRVQNTSYIIYKDGPMIKAANGTTGVIGYSGSDASIVTQSAINALAKGGSIFFKTNGITEYIIPGRWTLYTDFKLTSSISVNNDVSIFSDGATFDITELNDVAFKFNPGGESYFIKRDYLTVSGLIFIGNIVNANTGAIDVLNWSRGMVIDNIKIFNVNYPITLRGAVYNATIQNSLLSLGNEGVRISASGANAPNAVKIHSCDISSYAKSINVNSGLTIKITNNYFEDTTTGINVIGGGPVHIIGNYFKPNANNKAIYTTMDGLIISGNLFLLDTNGTIGIHFNNSYGKISVTGNYFSIGTGAKGIYSTISTLASIVGNIGYCVTGAGYVDALLARSTISGNVLAGGNPSIKILGSYNTITGNSFYGHATALSIGAGLNIISNNQFSNGTVDLDITAGGNNIINENYFTGSVLITGIGHKIKNNVGYITENSGILIVNGDGITKTFNILHGLASNPKIVELSAKHIDAAGDKYWTIKDTDTIIINFIIPPSIGINNVIISWKAEV